MAAKSRLNPALRTYYEHRVFMLYQPDDFRMYLGRMADGPNWMSDSARKLDLMAWGTLLVYQARMEPFGFNQNLTRLQDARGMFLEKYQVPAAPLSQPLYRLQLTMQLGLEAVTRRAQIDSRIDEEPARVQLIFDTLYYVAALHNRSERTFKVGESDLAEYLRRHAEGDRGPRLPDEFPDPAQVPILFGFFREYLVSLAEPDRIRRETLDYASQLAPEDPARSLWMGLAGAILSESVIEYREPFETRRPKPNGSDEAPPSAQEERVLTFSFPIDQFGYRAGVKSDLSMVRDANRALTAFGMLLTKLFGDAAAAQQTAGLARILELVPAWSTAETALQATNHLTELTSAADKPGVEDEIKERELRLAAAQLQDYLRMLGHWSAPFALGLFIASRAAAAAPTSDVAVRRLIGLKALGALASFDPSREPPQVAADLDQWFGSASAWPAKLTSPWDRGSAQGRPSIETDPNQLADWCATLETVASVPVTDEWDPAWKEFWDLWQFPGAAVARASTAPTLQGLDLLHAAYHGGIPVMPRLRGSLSVGQWCRLLVVARSLHEAVPPDALTAASEALGFADDGEHTDEPMLAIFPRSSESSAWSWRPESGLRAIMLRPPDIVDADQFAMRRRWPGTETRLDASTEMQIITDALTKTNPRDRSPFAPLFRAAGLLMAALRGARRNPRLVIYIEEGAPEPTLAGSEKALPRVRFGTSAPLAGAGPYVRSPSGVRDLAERAKQQLPRPPRILTTWSRTSVARAWDFINFRTRFREARLRRWARRTMRPPPG
jgi:hypothetical protein